MQKDNGVEVDEEFPGFSVSGVYVESALPHEPRAVPPILFVHGGLHGSWCWHYMMRYLRDRGWPCYALNWYNHYRSESLPLERFVRRTIPDVTEEIGLIAKHIGQTPVLIGHSMGGLASMKYAESAAVRGLVLVAPGMPAEIGKVDYDLPTQDGIAFGPPPLDWARSHFWPGCSEQDVATYYSLVGQESPECIRDVVNARVHIDRVRISHPILTLAGEHDKLVPPHFVRELASFLGAEYQFYPGRGHDIMMDVRRHEVASRLEHWLERIGQH